jgi:hypothetical protein
MSNTDQPGNVEEIAEGNAEAIAASQLEASLLFGPRPFAWCKTRGPNALIRG